MLNIYLIASCIVMSIQFPSSNTYANKGYGDWNCYVEFHSGVDFPIVANEFAQVPHYGVINYLINGYAPGSYDDCIALLSTDVNEVNGWSLQHLDFTFNPDTFYIGSMFIDFVAPCCDQSSPLVRHVHLAWMLDEAFTSPPYPQAGIVNPYDSLPIPSGYDEAMFGYIKSESPLKVRGMWFVRESDQIQPPFIPDFQSCIFGIVEAIVNPFSAANGVASRDSCGVRKLSYLVTRQNPYTSSNSYSPVPSFNWRTLFDMSGYLPDDGDNLINMPEFLAVYYNATSESHFTHNTVITNCGFDNIGSNCLDNVWPDDYDRASDWAAGPMCRGAWDTRLGMDSVNQIANHRLNARFFDGCYAIQVEAISQGSLDSETRFLPAVDVLQPETEANIKGVVVDNYMPYVEEVIVYQIPDFRILYSSEWSMNTFNAPASGMYLSSDSSFYLPLGQNNIGVAVKYSEVMNTTPYDIELNTESGGEITWESVAYFRPVSWNPLLGVSPSYEGALGAFWQCYETRGFNYGLMYSGRIRLCINAVSGASDLAGHYLDSDPETVVDPRAEITGDWTLTNYDNDSFDLSNIWGTAHSFSKITGIKYVGRCLDSRVEVDLPPLCATAIYRGDCNYICGFWMQLMRNSDPANPDTAYAIAVNGATEATDFFNIPKKHTTLNTQVPGSSDPAHSWVSYKTRTNEFIWFSVSDIEYNPVYPIIGEAIGSVVCVHPDAGIVYNQPVTNDTWYAAPVGVFNGCRVLDIVPASETSVMVTFYNATGINEGYCDSIEIQEPAVLDIALISDCSLEGSSETLSLDGSGTRLISLGANPCRESIPIYLSGYEGKQFQINLFDLTGRSVYEDRVLCQSSAIHVDIEDFPMGVYVLSLRTEGHTERFKIMIR